MGDFRTLIAMILQNKTILLISPEPWEHVFVSKHHYATHLAANGNRVYFLNPPGNIESISNTNFKNVFSVNYTGFPAGLRFYPHQVQKYFIKRMFCHLQELCHVKFDIIWSFDNSIFFDFSALPTKTLCISHIVDLSQNFQTKLAASTANVCFACSENIVTRLKLYQKFSFKINHGVAFQPSYHTALANRTRKLAVYSGNLAIPYIDWALLTNLVVTFPQVDFLFLGPYEKAVEKVAGLRNISNVEFKGAVRSEELQGYYKTADVLLVVYKAKEFREQVSNPHKLLEYMISGKAVVATFMEEYVRQDEEDLLAMSNLQNEFVLLFEKVITNLEYWNSEALQAKRKAFAMNNTYDKQISRIEDILKTL